MATEMSSFAGSKPVVFVDLDEPGRSDRAPRGELRWHIHWKRIREQGVKMA